MEEIRRPEEPVYAEHLSEAKDHLRELIVEIFTLIPNNKTEENRRAKFMEIINFYNSVRLFVSADYDEDSDTNTVSLKICLLDGYSTKKTGFALDLTMDEALSLVYKLKPEEYLALCEEGILKMLEGYKDFINKEGKDNEYGQYIELIQKKLIDVQSAAPNELENIFFYLPS